MIEGRGGAFSLGEDPHLVDTSVFARAHHPMVAPVWSEAIRRDLLVSCGPFVLEAVVSARDAGEARVLLDELTAGLRYVELDETTWRLAYDAQQAMATRGAQWHRRPPTDYLIAAAAHRHDLAVLHYDHDYDRIAADSGLRFRSTWIAEPGSLETPGEQPQVVRVLDDAGKAPLRLP